jgi:hypothetical protein
MEANPGDHKMKIKPVCKTTFLLVAAVFCFLAGCRKERPYWRDILVRQTLDFLRSQGVSVRYLVIGNDGRCKLDLSGSAITDLGILEGMPIDTLILERTPVRDLSPLREMRLLRKLDVADTGVSDLSPLKGLALHELNITMTAVVDLDPIKDMPLKMISMVKTEIYDFTALRGLPLEEFYFSPEKNHPEEMIRILREKTSLRCINFYGRKEKFWSEYDSGKFRPATK